MNWRETHKLRKKKQPVMYSRRAECRKDEMTWHVCAVSNMVFLKQDERTTWYFACFVTIIITAEWKCLDVNAAVRVRACAVVAERYCAEARTFGARRGISHITKPQRKDEKRRRVKNNESEMVHSSSADDSSCCCVARKQSFSEILLGPLINFAQVRAVCVLTGVEPFAAVSLSSSSSLMLGLQCPMPFERYR